MCCGPSLRADDVAAARAKGWRILAVNNAWEFGCDALYACDGKWWRQHGVVAQAPLRITQDAAVDMPGVVRVPSVARPGLSGDPLRIHQGGGGGYQALNLAVLMGARRVVFLGLDCQGTNARLHYHGNHPAPLNNPGAAQFEQWAAAFRRAVGWLDWWGVEVINASRATALTCFPRAALEDLR